MSSVFDEVVQLLTEVVGDDFLLDIEITPETSFNDDLALESIEFVALSEKLQEHYGARVNLVSFVGDMEIDQIMAITVGQLVEYIESQLAVRF
ncbi:MAG: acyl carrier protein [Streptosporangiaceae bacterium]